MLAPIPKMYQQYKYPCTKEITTCIADMDCLTRILMFGGCSDADENKSKCVEVDEKAGLESGWTNQLKKEATCLDTCNARAIATDIYTTPAPSTWKTYTDCVY